MRRFVLSVALTVAVLSTSGCSLLFGKVNQDFAKASKLNAEVLFPEYEDYIDNDDRLDADTKDIRKGTSKRWMKLIDEALDEE